MSGSNDRLTGTPKQNHESLKNLENKDLEAASSCRSPEQQLTRKQHQTLSEGIQEDLGKVCAAFRSLCKERDDLVEVCAPWDSPLAQAVLERGGRAARLGLHNGYDLSTRQGYLLAAQYIRQHRPRYLHFSPPCFPWSPMMNANQRTPEQRARLERARQNSKKILKHCRKLLELQVQELRAESSGLMLRTLRDAQATPEVLELAKKFECTYCKQRGRTMLRKPSTPTRITEKWHTVSVDTFWWQSPHKVNGQPKEHGVGISFLDEATDFHVACFVRVGSRKQSSVSSEEFRAHFSQDWIRVVPTPKVLRFDDEGCFRDHSLIEWLESKGIQPQVIAGESPWQNVKHSRHLEVLKENMSLLASELPEDTPCREILALSVGAKNELHQIRGFTPNQWAFGQAKGRLESFLQQGANLAVQSSQASESYQDQLQVVLESDARRRVSRALLARARRTESFECGNLVYYWRKGRGSLDGAWHGPGRVVCVEKTGDDLASGSQGSIVWTIHGIVLYRCSPEQLRHVTAESQEVDAFLQGNMTPSQLLADLKTSMHFRDISQDMSELPHDDEIHSEGPSVATREHQTGTPERAADWKVPACPGWPASARASR